MQQLELVKANPDMVRGCGSSRVRGGIYVESGSSPRGRPLELFLQDPVPPVPEGLVVPVRGVTTFTDETGVTHLIDRVGTSHYPYSSDLIEEVRRGGLSRMVTLRVANVGLSEKSHIYLVHDGARVVNGAELADFLYDDETRHNCALYNKVRPHRLDHLKNSKVACSRFPYAVAPHDEVEEQGEVVRYMRTFTASTHYQVTPPLPGGPEPVFEPGVVAILPITHISVVAGTDDDQKVTTLRGGVGGIPVSKSAS